MTCVALEGLVIFFSEWTGAHVYCTWGSCFICQNLQTSLPPALSLDTGMPSGQALFPGLLAVDLKSTCLSVQLGPGMVRQCELLQSQGHPAKAVAWAFRWKPAGSQLWPWWLLERTWTIPLQNRLVFLEQTGKGRRPDLGDGTGDLASASLASTL